jgi:hypothetical protein
MIVVDSTVWIDYFNGVVTWQTDRLDQLLQADEVLMGDLIFTEVLQGFRDDGDFAAARSALEKLPMEDMVGPGIALASAQNYRQLRKLGVTVRKTIDVIIATFCIENDYELLHNDRDFEPLVTHCNLRKSNPTPKP